MSGEPNKTTGQFHSLKGTVTENVGNLTGSTSWTQSGNKEHAEGETEYKAAQAKEYAQGISERVGGYKDSVVGAVVGDSSQQAVGNVRKEAGEAQQKINEPTT